VTYKCTGCDMVFSSKSGRDIHYRGECLSFVNVMDIKGKITRVERIDDKFECPLCFQTFKHSDKVVRHWNKCKLHDGTESNYLYIFDN
jgi:uncharacterized C2H2 Zn-finger protein